MIDKKEKWILCPAAGYKKLLYQKIILSVAHSADIKR